MIIFIIINEAYILERKKLEGNLLITHPDYNSAEDSVGSRELKPQYLQDN